MKTGVSIIPTLRQNMSGKEKQHPAPVHPRMNFVVTSAWNAKHHLHEQCLAFSMMASLLVVHVWGSLQENCPCRQELDASECMHVDDLLGSADVVSFMKGQQTLICRV